jgi:AraC-like DNA-binding protein
MAADMIRAQALHGYRELVDDMRGDHTRLLRRAGIRAAALDQMTALISFPAMINLLESSAAELDCADFGLRLADRQDVGVLGALAVAMRYSATVGDALRQASRYLYVHNPAVAFTTGAGEQPAQVRLNLELLHAHAADWAQTAEHGLGLAWRTVTLLSEGRSRLRGVWLPHPAVGTKAGYRSHFDAPISFRADHAALAIDASDLDLAISGQSSDLQKAAIAYLDTHTRRRRTSYRARVRQRVERLLGTGTCSSQHVANTLHMHPRTLQRRLREEGTTFDEIKDQTRRDFAQRYLANPDVSLTQVAALIDYQEQSALSRSCQRWFNATPRSVRSNLTPRTRIPSTT